MRSIRAKFEEIQKQNPGWSTYACFAEAVRGQNFNKRIVRLRFNQLVNPDDYAKEEKHKILSYLNSARAP